MANYESTNLEQFRITNPTPIVLFDPKNPQKQQFSRIAKELFDLFPYIPTHTGHLLMWNNHKKCFEALNEMLLTNIIEHTGIVPNTNLLHTQKRSIMSAINCYGANKIPEASCEWVHFGDFYFNVITEEQRSAGHYMFIPNRIPWTVGISDETPVLDKLFKEWVGEENYLALYDILAYCLLRENPLNLVFAFVGGGANGKSTFLEVIRKFLGTDNVVASNLYSISTDKFAKAAFYKKSAVFISETPNLKIDDWMNLKALCSNDEIDFEFKYQDRFTARNYAKILICSNGLPITIDNSDGFYRRWIVIDFPNQFFQSRDIISEIPNVEFENLARRCTKILTRLMVKRKFINELSLDEKRQRYLMASNPFPLFKNEFCVAGSEYSDSFSAVYDAYKTWLLKNHRRVVEWKVLKEWIMNGEAGLELQRESMTNNYVIVGLRLKTRFERDNEEAAQRVDDDKPMTVLQETISESSGDLCEAALRDIIGRENNGYCIDDVIIKFPGRESEAAAIIQRMINKGDLYSPKNNHVMAIK